MMPPQHWKHHLCKATPFIYNTLAHALQLQPQCNTISNASQVYVIYLLVKKASLGADRCILPHNWINILKDSRTLL